VSDLVRLGAAGVGGADETDGVREPNGGVGGRVLVGAGGGDITTVGSAFSFFLKLTVNGRSSGGSFWRGNPGSGPRVGSSRFEAIGVPPASASECR